MSDRFRPIETEYGGHRFRSRLEARYAVAFDHMRLTWRYEVEGFELPGGGRYLPDFFIVEWDAYVEIKPEVDLVSETDLRKAYELSVGTGKPVYLIAGPLDDPAVIVQLPVGGDEVLELAGEFIACAHCGAGCLRLLMASGIGYSVRRLATAPSDYPKCAHEDFLSLRESHIGAALRAAQHARFEFGERG